MAAGTYALVHGFDYQHLYSWLEILSLLDASAGYDHARIEHPSAGSADDVTLHPSAGSGKPARYMQVKWHVDVSTPYSFASLLEAPSGKVSLLHKLARSWGHHLGAAEDVEIWLVSNRSPDALLGRCLAGAELSDRFLSAPDTSDIGEARQRWAQALGDRFERFVPRLRFLLPLSADVLERWVDDRMRSFGLKTGADAHARGVKLVKRWMRGQHITREVLLRGIAEMGLRQEQRDVPRVSLWIHGYQVGRYGDPPTHELDWTELFSNPFRRTLDDRTWEARLPALLQAKGDLSRRVDDGFIDFRGKLPLTSLLAIGAQFPARAGFAFRCAQDTEGRATSFWRSREVEPSSRGLRVEVRDVGDGEDVLVVFALSKDVYPPEGEGDDEVSRFVAAQGRLRSVVKATPDPGPPGQGAIASNEDLIALVNRARHVLDEAKSRTRRDGNLHLIVVGPAAFALFLGQRLNALGDIATWELEGRGYQRSVTLRTS